mmetsp:Transcript_8925/g.17976  ORF Transcript_8925/g.17976 Transcript_8925/m.17976 type:complete len:165 (+) Transcript_8925:129-623(+)|eukprot:CAMPEP_0184683954 /NCGR_PEP_ID=MMETSP0312-20130426/13337_1 /TAXON_ID=31354 /ORGANISM="Compsopogon coeruleus, Strain SAG 36.94" /LENGTH=164 /DNA_ID=CAMNT_0027136709 /DNA_START=90 /DNA_END=584 /DNA_ORIENTATION=-
MVAAIPVAKLLGVALKQVSKPLASQLKAYCKTNEGARAAATELGQKLHRFSVHVLRRSMDSEMEGHAVARLKDEKALDRGVEVIGEGFVLTVVVGVTALEVYRQRVKDAKTMREKEDRKRAKVLAQERDAANRDARIEALERELAEIKQGLVIYRSGTRAGEAG